MRTTIAILACLLAGCSADREAPLSSGGEDGAKDPAGSPPASCIVDADCSTAASTCCECPEFAVSVEDPTFRACTGVVCPGERACADNVRAACDQGTCVLACVPMVCPATCDAGFTIDPTGCLSCACAVPEPTGCMEDADCVETRADCCGCDQGGANTAVLATEQASFDAMLGCPAAPACPAVNTCEPGAAPTCIQGRCELSTATNAPIGACGTAELPPCPTGTVCTVNTSDPANMQGVGLCVPP